MCVCQRVRERERDVFTWHSVPELSLSEAEGLTSDQMKELAEEVDKLAQEKVGEVSHPAVTYCQINSVFDR